MSGRQVCAIFGARGPGGNVQTVLDHLLERMQASGATVGQYSLIDHAVAPIADCRHCDRYHGCIHHDNGPALIDTMLEADTIVLASPTYWGGPSAQLKAFIDRWSCVPDADMKKRIAGRQLVGLTTYGIPDEAAVAPFRGILENVANYFSLPPLEFLALYCGRHGNARDPRLLQAVEQLAGRLLK